MKEGDPPFTPLTVARKLALRNPFVLAPQAGRGRDDEIAPCLCDNGGCLWDPIQRDLPIRCIQNPRVGFEHEVDGR